jgi:O-acetyl-ADP-ribose deacetylase (regulator of RNase III)
MKIQLVKGDITKIKVDAIATIYNYMDEDTTLEKVVFVCYNSASFQVYDKKLTTLGLI